MIPMLPEALSNELCSLKPDVDRLCMVCDMDVTGRGPDRGSTSSIRPVMHSRARLTYTQVWNWLSDAVERAARRRRRCCPGSPISTRCSMRCSARAKRAARSTSTASRCSSNSTCSGKIVRIVPVVRNDAHKLIEECMLAANVCTAEFLARHKHPALYRVHEGPTPRNWRSSGTSWKLRTGTPGGDEAIRN